MREGTVPNVNILSSNRITTHSSLLPPTSTNSFVGAAFSATSSPARAPGCAWPGGHDAARARPPPALLLGRVPRSGWAGFRCVAGLPTASGLGCPIIVVNDVRSVSTCQPAGFSHSRPGGVVFLASRYNSSRQGCAKHTTFRDQSRKRKT